MGKTAPKRKAANGYKLAEPLPKGEILQDISKQQWKLGSSIGKGGFGEIYSAQKVEANGSKYPYVVKIEPHSNGPLFVEMHFYMRNAKEDDVKAFKKERGLKTFGMPLYLGSGSHEYKNEKYRFIVMEKFGTDLWKLFLENNRIFPATTVFKVAIQILDVLEYIHKRGYVHGDIKGANILMGTTKDTQNKQVFLVDFGLACKYSGESVFKPDPKKAHDGTIEYLSRDAHSGVPSPRGDLEILAYNMIQWLGCTLPWEKNLKDPKIVQKSKDEFMANVPKFIKACFEKKSPPGPIVDFLNYHSTLKHDSVPDYKNIRKIFMSGLEKGDAMGKPLHFSPSKKTPIKRNIEVTSTTPKQRGRKKVTKHSDDEVDNTDNEENLTTPQKKRKGKQPSPKQKKDEQKLLQESSEDEKENMVDDEPMEESVEENQMLEDEETEEPPTKRSKGKTQRKPTSKRKPVKKANITEMSEQVHENIEGVKDDEELPRTSGRTGRTRMNYREDSDDEKKSKNNHVTGDSSDSAERYNDAMKEVIKKKIQNGKSRSKKKEEKAEDEENDMTGYTDSMKEIVKKKQKPRSKKKEAQVEDEEIDMAGYTDSMKEIVKKKQKPRSKKKEAQVEDEENDMAGYTDSMKEIAMKKLKKTAASTSSYKGSIRSRKGKAEPQSQQEVIDNSQSDSE